MAISHVLVAEGQKTDGTTITLSLPGLQQGDIVVVIEGEGSTSGPRGISTGGYTSLSVDTDNSTVSLGAYYKVMGASPDSDVVINAGANTVGHAAVAQVLRGATSTSIAATVATGSVGSPNSPSITMLSSGAWAISAAAKDVSDIGVDPPAFPVTFTNEVEINSDTTNDVTVAAATGIPGAAGSFDPGGWSSWTGGTNWIAITIAIEPAAVPTNWDGATRFSGAGSLRAFAYTPTAHAGQARFGGAGSFSAYAEILGVKFIEARFAGTGSLRVQATGGISLAPSVLGELARYENVEFDDSGNVFVNPTVTVTNEDGSDTFIYEDRDGDVLLDNPFTVGGNDAFTKALLHFDGTDESTTILDENFNGWRRWFSDSGVIDRAQSKFGGASLRCGNESFSNDQVYREADDDLVIGAQEFAVDFWFRAADSGGFEKGMTGQVDSVGAADDNTAFYIRKTSGNVIQAGVTSGTTETSVTGTTQYTAALNAGWHHCAFLRTGNTLKLLIDGGQQGGDVAFSGTVNTSTAKLGVGGGGDYFSRWHGHIDEYRLSIGTSRWTGGFTPQAFAYNDVLYGFHAPGGAYRIDISDGVNDRTRRYVGIGTANELDAESMPGEPPVDYANGVVLLETIVLEGGETAVEFTEGLDNTYDFYEVQFSNVSRDVEGVTFNLRIETGGSFKSGASDYEWQKCEALTASADREDAQIVLHGGGSGPFTGFVRFANPEQATMACLFGYDLTLVGFSSESAVRGSGRYRSLGAITGLQFFNGSNFAFETGVFSLFGYSKQEVEVEAEALIARFAGAGSMRVDARYHAPAVRFSGDDYATRGGGLTGAADSKMCTYSVWIRKQGADGVTERVFLGNENLGGGAATRRVRITKNSGATNDLGLGANPSPGDVVQISSSTDSIQVADGWRHVLLSIDLTDTNKRHIYVNDVSDLNVTTYVDANIDFTLGDWSIGGNADGSDFFDGDLADLWFAPGVYIDFSVEANRRKFISPTGKPVFLGVDGSVPTGSAPLVFFHGNASNFYTNRGTGGTFTVGGGTLTDSPTSPSD